MRNNAKAIDEKTINIGSAPGSNASIRTSSPYIAYVVMKDMNAMIALESMALLINDLEMLEERELWVTKICSSSSLIVSSSDNLAVSSKCDDDSC